MLDVLPLEIEQPVSVCGQGSNKHRHVADAAFPGLLRDDASHACTCSPDSSNPHSNNMNCPRRGRQVIVSLALRSLSDLAVSRA